MLINEKVIRSFIRSILFETDEKIKLEEIFQPDPHHFTGSNFKNIVASKYTIFDTHGPDIGKEEIYGNKKANKPKNPISVDPEVDSLEAEVSLYDQICNIKNKELKGKNK